MVSPELRPQNSSAQKQGRDRTNLLSRQKLLQAKKQHAQPRTYQFLLQAEIANASAARNEFMMNCSV